jgi:nucleoside-diphosphate-sugar epimerase
VTFESETETGRDRMIMITGATGNVESEVVAALLSAGEPVRGCFGSTRSEPGLPNMRKALEQIIEAPAASP